MLSRKLALHVFQQFFLGFRAKVLGRSTHIIQNNRSNRKFQQKICPNHFAKIHRSVLCKITIDLFYFWDVYDVNLLKKKFGRSMAYSCRANVFIEFHRFKKKSNRHSWRLSNWSKIIQINGKSMGFSKLEWV